MKDKLLLLKDLHNACKENVQKRLATIQSQLSSIEESKNNDTKSSAGDKYETGRAMMQIEEDKMKRQLFETNLVSQELGQIDVEEKSSKVILGSLVTTNKGEYYLSIGIGKITVNEQLFYCLSISSPIGAKMLNKEVGDKINFNGSEIKILEIN